MSLTEQWVRLYTAGLPEQLRRERRDEIASDVFEQYADGAGRRAVVGRTVRGAVDDLIWRREVARGMASSPGFRAVLTQSWWAPAAAMVAVFDVGFATWIAASERSTMPGRVIGPALVLLAATAMTVGLMARTGRATTASTSGGRLAVVAVALAVIAAFTVGGPTVLLVAAVTLVLALSALVRRRLGGAAAVDGLVLVGTLPAILMFWLVLPALLAVVVIAGVLSTRPAATAAPA